MRYKRISPIMTSNTTPEPYVVARSSVYSATYEAYKAVDGGADTTNSWTTVNGTVTGWLSIDLSTPEIVNCYSVTCGNNTTTYITGAPKDWTFEGSNDNVEWTILDTQANITYSMAVETKQFTFENSTPYRYYRINIAANNGNTTWSAIGEFILYQAISGDSKFYVSQQHGDDANDGLTPQTAWATITKAANTVGGSLDGDTYVYIGPGTYREFVSFTSGGLDSEHRLIFAGDPNCLYLTNDNPGIVRITGCDLENELPSAIATQLIKMLFGFTELWDVWVDGGVYNQYLLYGTVQYGGNGQICRRVRANGYYGFGYLICYDCFAGGYVGYGYCEAYNCIGIGGANTNAGVFYGSRSFNCLAMGGYYGYYGGWSYNSISMYNVYGYYGGYSNNCATFWTTGAAYNTGTHLNIKSHQSSSTSNIAPLLLDINIDILMRKGIADGGLAFIPATRVMTSNSAPAPYVVSRSSVYNSTYEGWKAFNQTNTVDTDCWITVNGTTTGWLAYDTGRKTRVDYYRLASRNHTTGITSSPRDWTFEGSNNNVDWEVIDTQTEQTFDNAEEKTYYLSSPVWYRYFRINVTANNGYAYLCIAEFSFGETMRLALPKDIVGNNRVGANDIVDLGPFEVPDYIVDWENYYEKPPSLKLQGASQVVFKFPVEANRDVIKLVRVKHINTAVDKKPQLVCRGLGMEFSSSSSAESDTWEQLSLNFTPTKTGIMEFVLSTRDTESTSYSLFSDII
jgi:hypothetical protein